MIMICTTVFVIVVTLLDTRILVMVTEVNQINEKQNSYYN